jgi:hypothetical protein
MLVMMVGAALIGWPGLWVIGLPLSIGAWIATMVLVWRGVQSDRREGVDRSTSHDRFWHRWSLLVVALLLGFALLLIALTILVALGHD